MGEGGMQGHRVARAPGRRLLELPLRSDWDVDRGGGVGGSARRVDLELRWVRLPDGGSGEGGGSRDSWSLGLQPFVEGQSGGWGRPVGSPATCDLRARQQGWSVGRGQS